MNKKKLKIARNKVDQLDKKIFNLIKIRTQIVNTTSIFAEHLTLPFPLGDGTGVKSGTPKGFVFGVTSTEV